MIGRQYKAHKDNVIDIFESYKAKRGALDDGVDVKFLEKRIESLRNGKFTLAVAGEVKAGKSTFINALLGKEILPSDVLQASSAIVEIFKSENSFLKVKYADGEEEIIQENLDASNRVELNARLHEICRINDNYRDIPTTLIDNYIIANDGKLEVDGELLKSLEQNSGEHLQGKQKDIEEYISRRVKEKIPVQIEFGYPLKWDFDELRIVDSPGVNATGGVQDISFRFFEEANAILFVHPIKPIESESFKKFVNSVISNRSKEALFLILTHAGLYSHEEVQKLHIEAGRLFNSIIPENRILVVDSLLKLIHCDLSNGISIEEIRKSENKKKILSSYREQAEDEGRDLIDVVYENSHFEEMFSAIDEFSMKAPNLQLQEILERIRCGYEEQENLYTEKAARLEKKKRNPQEFEDEINRINMALERYKNLTKVTKESLINEYTGKSEFSKEMDSLKVMYPELITGSNSIETARKYTVDALNAVQETIDSFSKELTQKLGEVLEASGKKFAEEHKISIPKVDLLTIEQKAKKTAYREEDRYETFYEKRWYTLWLYNHECKRFAGKTKIFDDNKFLGDYKTSCNEEFYKIVNNLSNELKKVLNVYLDTFSKKMDSAINERQKALENEKLKKQNNEELIAEIKEMQTKKKDIQPEKSRCIEVLEDIL